MLYENLNWYPMIYDVWDLYINFCKIDSIGCMYLQWSDDVLHHHKVDEEDDKNYEERHIEESVLYQSS